MPNEYKESYVAFFGLLMLTLVAVTLQLTVGLNSEMGRMLSIVGIGSIFGLISLKGFEHKLESVGSFLFKREIKPWLLYTLYFIGLLWWITIVNTGV